MSNKDTLNAANSCKPFGLPEGIRAFWTHCQLGWFLGVVSGVFLLYVLISPWWAPLGGGLTAALWMEYVLVLICAALLYFPTRKHKSFSLVLAVFPVIFLYSTFDLFFGFVRRTLRPADVKNIVSVDEFSWGLAIAFYGGILLFALVVVFAAIRHLREFHQAKTILVMTSLARVGLVAVLLLGFFSESFAGIQEAIFVNQGTSEQHVIRRHGRACSFLFYGHVARHNRAQLKVYADREMDVNSALYPGQIRKPRNIHIIVLESFIDMRKLKGVPFNRSPMADELQDWLHQANSDFSTVISPSYGGDTACAEFELLTGLPSLKLVDSIEFNVMQGGASSGLPQVLSEQGYQALATVGCSSSYFNSPVAYDSLGFSQEQVVYLGDDPERYVGEGDRYLFDGDLFQENLRRLKQHLETAQQPVFNYVLGMYGHTPYARNVPERPDVIQAPLASDRINRIANLFYYRTQALASYLQALHALDPEGLVYITSDHLPAILDENVQYAGGDHDNMALLLDAGRVMDVSGKKYHEIPWLLWDRLAGESHERVFSEKELEAMYYKTLSESLADR